MKDILVKDILEQCNGKLLCGNKNELCENFSKDTRTIQEGDIYLGIKGEKFNGSIFFEEALQKGAKGCILQDIEIDEQTLIKYKDKFIIIVKNVVWAIQELAKYKRSLYNIPVIGVTGSVGKTSTKDIIASILSQKYKVLKTEGNYNNEIGLPLTILKLKDHQAMVVEMGMSAFGEISLLTNIAKPTVAVITIIGSSHIGELGSRENILKAKLEILEVLDDHGCVIINNDNDLLHSWYENNTDNHKHITYGIENKSMLMAKNIILKEKSSEFSIEYDEKSYNVEVPVAGKHFIYNTLAAICVGIKYDISMDEIIKGVLEFEITKRRMEILKKENGATIINDSYNASYESTKAALDYLGSTNNYPKIAVLGDILELGEFSKQMHENVGKEVVKNKIDVLITVGKEAMNISGKAIELGMNRNNVYQYLTNDMAIDKIKELQSDNSIILVKASNGMHFNEIIEAIK